MPDLEPSGADMGGVRGAAWRSRFRDGVVATLPLLVGAVPFGLVFGASALANGWSAIETIAISLFIFAGSAQLALLSLVAGGSSGIAVVLAILLINLRHILYGLSLARWLPRNDPPPRWLLAATVTDESFGLTTREVRAGRASAAFLWGSSLTLYVSFAGSTTAGVLLGEQLPDPGSLGLDLIFPLTFLALLLTVVRGWRDWLIALIAAGLVMVLRQVVDGGTALLVTTIVAAAFGAWLTRDQPLPGAGS